MTDVFAASVPLIDVASLFDGPCARRTRVDREISRAAADAGLFLARGFPPELPVGPGPRSQLLDIFRLTTQQTRRLWRRKFAPAHPNIYRGWFPLQPGFLTSKEGIDLGPDIAYGSAVVVSGDPLREATPVPAEEELPGWRDAAVNYYLAMVRISQALMHSLARSLDLPEGFFDSTFERGVSTLRLVRYPPRNDLDLAAQRDGNVWIEHEGRRCHLTGAPHVDSGFLTLLAQDGVAGLQARHRNGSWIDVPPLENTLAVNFGKVLERWSGGRFKATEHRVIGTGEERLSVPFFYEARADAVIRPLPLDSVAAFEPFCYGDYLWKTITQFVEFEGMESQRQV